MPRSGVNPYEMLNGDDKKTASRLKLLWASGRWALVFDRPSDSQRLRMSGINLSIAKGAQRKWLSSGCSRASRIDSRKQAPPVISAQLYSRFACLMLGEVRRNTRGSSYLSL
jgi:hypothetical protein